MDGPVIDKKINLRRGWSIHCWQANHPLQPDLIALCVNGGCLVSKGPADYCRKAMLASRIFRRLIIVINQWCASAHINEGTAIIGQLEGNSGPSHGKSPYNIDTLSLLGAVSLQKFEARGNRFEQLCYRNQTARLQCSGFWFRDPATIDLKTPGVRHACHYRG